MAIWYYMYMATTLKLNKVRSKQNLNSDTGGEFFPPILISGS